MAAKTPIESLKPDELDGVLALKNAIRSGMDISIYPRQVIICKHPTGHELSFIHGLPGNSGLGPVTYAQDKRMRRSLMERAKVPVPKGATFTLGRGVPLAKRFAKRIGFPVIVKPAIGDNGIEAFRNITSVAVMNRALDYLRKPTSERETYTRAAYGLTELREPGVENGRVTVPPGYMFLVEKQLSGQYVRFLVNHGQVVSAILCEGYPADGTLQSGKDVFASVHPEIVSMVLKAAKVIPGLPVVAIDAVIPDFTAPLENQQIGFVEYSERPGLWVQAKADPDLAITLSESIFKEYSKSLNANIVLAPSESETQVTFEAHAIPDAESGSEAMVTEASNRGLKLALSDVQQLAGTAKGTLSGSPLSLAEFVDALLEGQIEGAPVMLVKLYS